LSPYSWTAANAVNLAQEVPNRASLIGVTIGTSVMSIGDNVFYKCSNLISITIPTSVTSIVSDTVFEFSGLTTVTILNNQIIGISSPASDVFFFGRTVTTILPNS
jgi:hypothetical protein